jgi:hypothetical protein
MLNAKVSPNHNESDGQSDDRSSLTVLQWLLLHFLKAQEEREDGCSRASANSGSSLELNAAVQQLRTLVDQLGRVERARAAPDLIEDEYSTLNESRTAGLEAIADSVREVINLDPSLATYIPSEGLAVSLGEGRELVLFEGLSRKLPKFQYRNDAVNWMRERGEGDDLENLSSAIERAIEEQVRIPHYCFGMLTLQWHVRNLHGRVEGTDHSPETLEGNWLDRLRSAVDALVRIARRLESYPGDKRLIARGKTVEREIYGIALENKTGLRMEKDAAFSCDLGDGRELKAAIIFGVVSPRNRAEADAWLNARGKRRIKDNLQGEICAAMEAGETLPPFLRGRHYEIEVRQNR